MIPDSISRDQLGREKINGLFDYFKFKFGDELSSSTFHRARHCFIQSLAAYSIVTYLLAIRDRHNGNIMVDDKGHIIHIGISITLSHTNCIYHGVDFGFILDIAPGGIKFETSPFKLTKEMIQLLGDSPDSSYFQYFKELCVLAFLSLRPYAEKIVSLAALMLDSNLPCFKLGKPHIRMPLER